MNLKSLLKPLYSDSVIVARFHIWGPNLYRWGGLDEYGWCVFASDHRARHALFLQSLSRMML